MRLVNASLNHDRPERTMSSIGRKSGRPRAGKYHINLWCQKQCNAIYETERARGFAHATRTIDTHSYSIKPLSPALLHFFHSSGRGGTKRTREGKEDGGTEKIAGDQFWRADKKCTSDRVQFFPPLQDLTRETNVSFRLHRYTRNRDENIPLCEESSLRET